MKVVILQYLAPKYGMEHLKYLKTVIKYNTGVILINWGPIF